MIIMMAMSSNVFDLDQDCILYLVSTCTVQCISA